ncbi:MAG: hypothetical protein RLZZ153_1750, partial [Pseudomonadota bacterium]
KTRGFDQRNRSGPNIFFVDQSGGLFLRDETHGLGNAQPATGAPAWHLGEQSLHLLTELFHASSTRHGHDRRGRSAELNIDFALIELAFAQLFAELLPRR